MSLTNLPDFYAQVGFGTVPGYTRVTSLGHNPSIDSATVPEDIWPLGGLYPWKAAAGAMEIVSTSTLDAAAGTGARTVLVQGLDANYVAVTETVTLNGTTVVALTNQYLRINALFIMSAGSTETNAGDILVRDSGGGQVRSVIPVGFGISRQAIYTVPAGFTLQILSQYIAISGGLTGSSRFADVKNFIRSSNGFFRTPLTLTTQDGRPYRHDGVPGIILSEKSDFALRCSYVSNNSTPIVGAFLAILRKN